MMMLTSSICPNSIKGMTLDQYPEFRGLVLGLLESHHRDTNKLRVDVVILNCTHKRFMFQPFYGDEAQQQLDLLNKIATDNLHYIGDFFVRWCWGNKEGISHAVSRYGLKRYGLQLDRIPYGIPIGIIEEPSSPPYVELQDSINSLWHFITKWRQTAQEGDIPIIPKSFRKSLRLLEHQCLVVMQGSY